MKVITLQTLIDKLESGYDPGDDWEEPLLLNLVVYGCWVGTYSDREEVIENGQMLFHWLSHAEH